MSTNSQSCAISYNAPLANFIASSCKPLSQPQDTIKPKATPWHGPHTATPNPIPSNGATSPWPSRVVSTLARMDILPAQSEPAGAPKMSGLGHLPPAPYYSPGPQSSALGRRAVQTAQSEPSSGLKLTHFGHLPPSPYVSPDHHDPALVRRTIQAAQSDPTNLPKMSGLGHLPPAPYYLPGSSPTTQASMSYFILSTETTTTATPSFAHILGPNGLPAPTTLPPPPTPRPDYNCHAPYDIGWPVSAANGVCINYDTISTKTSTVNCAGCPVATSTMRPKNTGGPADPFSVSLRHSCGVLGLG